MHIGGIEHEVREIRAEISKKADQHEIHTLRSDVSKLETIVQDLQSTINGFSSQIAALERGEVVRY